MYLLLADSTAVGGPACPDDPEKHPFGVKLAPSVGINLDAEADEVIDSKTTTLANVVIAVRHTWKNMFHMEVLTPCSLLQYP